MNVHHDINAELNIIYAIGTGSNHTSRIFKELKESDFLDKTTQRRFGLYHKAFQAGQLHEFAAQYIDKLEAPADIMPIWDAAKIVQNHAIRRKVQSAADEILISCADYSNSIKELQDQLKTTIIEAIDTRITRSPSRTDEDIEIVKDGMRNTTTAFRAGLPSVDTFAPIQPGDFVLIGARPGVGKSALATSMIIPNMMGNDKKRGLFFCIEMDTRQGYSRISSQLSNVPLSKYISAKTNPPTEKEMIRIDQSLIDVAVDFPERWFIEGSVSIDEIDEMVEIHKPDWIMIDYAQLVKAKAKDIRERNEIVSQELRQLGLRRKTAVIALVQLNRSADGSTPSSSQIKHSGQYEQDATHIFLLDRPESEPLADQKTRNYYSQRGERIEMIVPSGKTNKACLICSKNRNGPTFYTILDFNPATTQFTEYED